MSDELEKLRDENKRLHDCMRMSAGAFRTITKFGDELSVARASGEVERIYEALSECRIPPDGWRCTRAPGHEGPCAAISTTVATINESLMAEGGARGAE